VTVIRFEREKERDGEGDDIEGRRWNTPEWVVEHDGERGRRWNTTAAAWVVDQELNGSVKTGFGGAQGRKKKGRLILSQLSLVIKGIFVLSCEFLWVSNHFAMSANHSHISEIRRLRIKTKMINICSDKIERLVIS